MKTKFLIYNLLVLLVCCTVTLTSCSKDGDPTPDPKEEGFDFNNLKDGYFLYIKEGNNDGTNSKVQLLEFYQAIKYVFIK